MNLAELKAIVTGASRGMGRFFAEALCRGGAAVAACDVDDHGLNELESMGNGPGKLVSRRCDVTSEGDVSAFVGWAADALGGVNALVNNAGIFRDRFLVNRDSETGEVRAMSLDEWRAVIDVDLTGPFLLAREVAASMVAREDGPGVIINISSISRHGNMGQGNYAAAKAGLVAATRTWALELARHGIRVAAVAPGFIDTPMLRGMPERMLRKMTERIPLRRLGTPEEVWQALRFIIECEYVTGRVIEVDGGISL